MPTADYSSYHQPPGTGGDGTKLDNFIDAVQSTVNALDSNNLAAAAGITGTQLASGANIAATQFAAAAQARLLLAAPQKYVTLIDIVSSASEVDVLQAAGYTIPAVTLGASGIARVTIAGDYLNNTGGNVQFTPRIYFGGVKVYDGGLSDNVATSANRRAFRWVFEVGNLTTGTQDINGLLSVSNPATATTGTSGPSAASGSAVVAAHDSAGTVDTTASALLRATIQLASSSASHEVRVRRSLIEFV